MNFCCYFHSCDKNEYKQYSKYIWLKKYVRYMNITTNSRTFFLSICEGTINCKIYIIFYSIKYIEVAMRLMTMCSQQICVYRTIIYFFCVKLASSVIHHFFYGNGILTSTYDFGIYPVRPLLNIPSYQLSSTLDSNLRTSFSCKLYLIELSLKFFSL